MALNDSSQSSEPCSIISTERAVLERKRAALFDELSRLSPEKIVSGMNKHEHGDKRAGKTGRADDE